MPKDTPGEHVNRNAYSRAGFVQNGREHLNQGRLVWFADDFAAEFGVKNDTARKWIAGGQFGPTVTIGRRRGVRNERVLQWLREQEEPS